ncbi:hypothetical protein C1I92_23550 [Jiangella anatolica]|uniref:Uncharacterized protein n=1 Tax=Jiangella anatolica TaxID=2670374 RepID=A0A2W2B0H9_9ACTN|nr:hypothetical protein C1I92_23550 [Jiangella anatolica]
MPWLLLPAGDAGADFFAGAFFAVFLAGALFFAGAAFFAGLSAAPSDSGDAFSAAGGVASFAASGAGAHGPVDGS